MAVPNEWLDFLREQFPKGSRIRLRSHSKYTLEPGILGTLDRITDDGEFCVTWVDGRHTELTLGKDRFSVLPAEFQTLKLYMPLTADIYERSESGDSEEELYDQDGSHLIEYKDIIAAALSESSEPEEKERGIMHWYDEDTPVDIKVHSVFFDVEERDNCLWGVAECRVTGSLIYAELEELKRYITEHAMNGWGLMFSLRDIQLDNGKMNVYLWNVGDWSIQTEQERFSSEQVSSEQHPNERKMGGMTLE